MSKTKKLLAFFLMGATACVGAFAFAGCANSSKAAGDNDVAIEDPDVPMVGPSCDHASAVHFDAKAVSCTEDGNKEYWYCGDCRTFFADREFTKETSLAAVMEYSEGHNYGKLLDADAPDCAKNVVTVKHYYCDDCGTYFDEDQKEIENAIVYAVGHNYGNLIAAQEATCSTEGVKAHYHCVDCGKDFGTDKKELTDITVATTAHSYVSAYDYKTAEYVLTCSHDGATVREAAGSEEYPYLVKTVADLQTAVSNGGYVKLENDLTNIVTVKISNDVVIDLNGKQLTNHKTYANVLEVVADTGAAVTVKNGKIVNAYAGSNPSYCVFVDYNTAGGAATSLTLNGVELTAQNKADGKAVLLGDYSTCVMTDCQINGNGVTVWTGATLEMTGCTIASTNSAIVGKSIGNGSVVLEGCTVSAEQIQGLDGKLTVK